MAPSLPSDAEDPFSDFTLFFSEPEIKHIQRMAIERRKLPQPVILVVDDQDFSRKLLMEMISRNFTCYAASSVQQAVSLYAEYVPNIVFLDIEIPDVNGHDFAKFIKKYDPTSYIVMVTANNYEKDIIRARENKVQGYIMKPYSKQKIMDAIAGYTASLRKS